MAEIGRLDAEQLEVLEVARVVAARDHALDAVLLARHLGDEDVVLVVAGHGDHQVGALDAGALQHPQLGAVAVLDAVLELLLDDRVAARVGLDHGHLVALGDQLASEVPADLAGSHDQHVHGLAGHSLEADLAAHRGLEQLDRGLGGADGLEALLGVPAGTVRDRAPARPRVRPRSGAWRSGRPRGWCCRRRWRPRRRRRRSIPAASSASISSAVPTVKRPPRSSQLSGWPRSSSAMASGSSSRTETSFPSASIEWAIAEPTRPQPTIRTNIRFALYQSCGRSPSNRSWQNALAHGASSPAGGAVRITVQAAFSTT